MGGLVPVVWFRSSYVNDGWIVPRSSVFIWTLYVIQTVYAVYGEGWFVSDSLRSMPIAARDSNHLKPFTTYNNLVHLTPVVPVPCAYHPGEAVGEIGLDNRVISKQLPPILTHDFRKEPPFVHILLQILNLHT